MKNSMSLWEVYYKSSYYDDDYRMPGDVPVDERLYVVAGNYEEALKKADQKLQRLRRKHGKGEVEVKPIALENLVPARHSADDGRMGFISTQSLKAVQLLLDEDKKQFRLGVCLIQLNRKQEARKVS